MKEDSLLETAGPNRSGKQGEEVSQLVAQSVGSERVQMKGPGKGRGLGVGVHQWPATSDEEVGRLEKGAGDLWVRVAKLKDAAQVEARGTQETDKGPEDRAGREGVPCMKELDPLWQHEWMLRQEESGNHPHVSGHLLTDKAAGMWVCGWVGLDFKSMWTPASNWPIDTFGRT